MRFCCLPSAISSISLADILRADRDTISGWLNLWQEQGLDGLADAPKPGRRRKIDGSLEAVLRDILIENPSPNIKALLQAELKKRQTSLLGCREALLKTAWLHLPPGAAGAKKVVCTKRKQRVQKALLHLHRLEDAGYCHVLYSNESGFCLSPVVPYLWQLKGRTLGLTAKAHSRRLNVLGFLSRKSRLHSFQAQERMTASFVIESVESLLLSLCCPTVLVLDNATVHRAKVVQAKRKEWKQNGLASRPLEHSAGMLQCH